MNNAALMIEWGMPIEGRETKALEEFMRTMAWWGQLQAEKRIAAFHVYGPLNGSLSDRAGFVVIEGTDEQIAELQRSEDYRSSINRVATIGHNIRISTLETGEAMMTRMQRYGRNLKEVLG